MYKLIKSMLCLLFILIAMASVSNSSPSEDNTSGTDLNVIHTEDEQQIGHPLNKRNYNIW